MTKLEALLFDAWVAGFTEASAAILRHNAPTHENMRARFLVWLRDEDNKPGRALLWPPKVS